MSLLERPDKIESRDAFVAYVEALIRSLDQAGASTPIPYGPAIDDQGVAWQNTTLAAFLDAMDAWMLDTGWTETDRRESALWAALTVDVTDVDGDEDDLRRYLTDLRDRASNLDADQHWRPAAEALRAGRAYE